MLQEGVWVGKKSGRVTYVELLMCCRLWLVLTSIQVNRDEQTVKSHFGAGVSRWRSFRLLLSG